MTGRAQHCVGQIFHHEEKIIKRARHCSIWVVNMRISGGWF